MGVPKKKEKTSFWDYLLFDLYDDLLTFLSLIVLATIKQKLFGDSTFSGAALI